VSLPAAAAAASVAAAEAILKGLIGEWVSQGKDPQAEAIKIRDLYAPKAAIDAEVQAEIDAAPRRPTPNTGE
jgi:hypothetical protein